MHAPAGHLPRHARACGRLPGAGWQVGPAFGPLLPCLWPGYALCVCACWRVWVCVCVRAPWSSSCAMC